jgi:hypothetical protein
VNEYMNFFLDKKGNHYVSTPNTTRLNQHVSRKRSETNEKMPLRTPARSSHNKNNGGSFYFINAFSSRCPFSFHTPMANMPTPNSLSYIDGFSLLSILYYCKFYTSNPSKSFPDPFARLGGTLIMQRTTSFLGSRSLNKVHVLSYDQVRPALMVSKLIPNQ